MRWDLFCRVIDNLGDLGVGWRLACDLAARGQRVRLLCDDTRALAWMAPAGAAGVEVLPWQDPGEPAHVVVELFGCEAPPTYRDAMSRLAPAPVWINLEYLSAEDYVERSHGLPSPQPNGLTRWFFFPGFSDGSGGLLREPGLLERRAGFDRQAWLQSHGVTSRHGHTRDERIVSLFCYDNPVLPQMLHALGAVPTRVLLTPGHAQRLAGAAGALPPTLRLHALPWLPQAEYDHLLWACDLNFVRGEDSFVRAQWAGVPFVWQLYPQHDGAHAPKLEAFLQRFGAEDVPGLAELWRAWNGVPGRHAGAQCGRWPAERAPWARWPAWPDFDAWQAACLRWRDRLTAQGDLTTRLLAFVHGKTRGRC